MEWMESFWKSICARQGEIFRQKRGATFTYKVRGGSVVLSRTNHQIARSQFEEALRRMPLDGPGQLQDLRGPSYIFAIITDPRIGT